MQDELAKPRASAKKIMLAWLLIVIDIYFFIMLGVTTLKGAEGGATIVFLLLAIGILIYPAYVLILRSGIINKIAFVLAVLILLTPYIVASTIRGYGKNHFDGDIMGLVPQSMAAVIELRDLDKVDETNGNKLHQIIDFTQKLSNDTIYKSSLETEQAKKFFGEDPNTLKALDPIKKISNQFINIKEQLDDPRLETLNSIFGKFDIEKDLLSSEMIFSIAPEDGAYPSSEVSRTNEGGAIRVAPNKYEKFTYPKSSFLMLTRVSEKIKIYLNLDSFALDYVQMPGVEITIKGDYRDVHLQNEDLHIYYSLYEDVLGVSTEERLIRQYVSLCDKDGRDKTSFLASKIYETTKKLYDNDEVTKGTDSWNKSHLRISVNMEELKKMSSIEYILNVPDEILMTEAGEFVFRLIDELLKSLFDMKHLEGATVLMNFENTADSGLVLNAKSYGFYDEEKMPGVLAATYSMKPRKPALESLVSDRIFGYFEIDKDLQQFNEYLSSQTLNYNLTPTLGEVLLNAVGEFVSDKLVLFFRPQDLFKELPSENGEEMGAPPFTPLWAIGAELSELGQQQDSLTLASKILGNLIPSDKIGDADKIKEQFRFPIKRVGDYSYHSFVWTNPDTGENRIPYLLAPYFGPQADPAMAVVDGKYMVVATSKDMLVEMLEAKQNKTYRLNTDEDHFGDLGALEQKFENDTANITGRLDVRDFLSNFFTEQNIRNLAKAYSPEEPSPSIQKSYREWAERSAELNGHKGEEDFIERLYFDKVQRYQRSMAENRDEFLNNKKDARDFFRLVGQVGFAVKSLNQRNGFKFSLILTLGTQTEH